MKEESNIVKTTEYEKTNKAIEIIDGYVDEYENILKTERNNKANKDKYEYLIMTLKSILKELNIK